MKKILSLILAMAMTLALVACGGSGSTETDREIPDTAAGVLLQEFYNIVDATPDASAQEIAEKIGSHESIPFGPLMVMPVEPGLQMGFGNYEVTGFQEGAMFAPMVGAIAFVGYIFTLEEGTDAAAFVQGLTDNADPRWNICVEAEETLIRAEGNKVFFVMSPMSFEG